MSAPLKIFRNTSTSEEPPISPPTPRLAIDGGQPMLPAGPPSWPLPDQAIRDTLERCLGDGSWGRYHAGHVERLQDELAAAHQVPFAFTCCSGTFAVELALHSLKVSAGDEVILAGYDFPGNFRAIEAVGATPVLVDIDPKTWSLDGSLLAEAASPATRAILISHLHGGLADMRLVRAFADERGLSVVEDACQSPGAIVQGRPAGSWGDVGVLSFGGSKLLSAGRGGAILTASEETHQRAKIFCERGNHAFPLSEIQAAMLLPQLAELPARNATRLDNARRLIAGCASLPELVPVTLPAERGTPSYYKLAWRWSSAEATGPARAEFIAAIQAEGVAIDSGFRGFTRRGNRRCRRIGDLTASQAAADQTVLLHHPVLLQPASTLDQVAQAIRKIILHFRSSPPSAPRSRDD